MSLTVPHSQTHRESSLVLGIPRIKKVIEAVNKSEYLQGAFEEAMLELLETYLKLLNLPQHRWSSTALVLERILIAWEPLLQAYRKLNRPVPLTDMDRTLCIEFYSMIEPVWAVQIKAQAMQTFVIVDVYVKLWPESTELCKWWARQTSMPCLMQAAMAILTNKPSSGGLECDLGSLSDVLAPK
ncbi:unnamed protein product [Sphagnum balticum]